MPRISEIFYSVQGEIDIGVPSIFVRFSGCNLVASGKGCEWCDSLYAQDGADMLLSEVVRKISSYNCKNVVMTGGESLLQREGLFNLVGELMEKEYKLSIETNGTLFDSRLAVFNNINCSPKKQAINLDVLKRLNWLPQTRFKFVFDDSSYGPIGDRWWETVIDCVSLKVNKERVWIMPEGVDPEGQLEDSIKVIEYCKEKGFNFTPRLHILLWGSQRGK